MGAIISFFLFSSAGRYLLAGIAIIAALGAAYLKVEHDGYIRGSTEVKKQWDAAIAADIKRGEDARRDAEQFILQNPPTIYPSDNGQPPVVSVPNDQWNRDKGDVQPVAPHTVLSKPRHAPDHPASKNPQPHRPTSKVLVSCSTILWALKNLSKDTLDAYNASATPEEIAHAKACQAQKK